MNIQILFRIYFETFRHDFLVDQCRFIAVWFPLRAATMCTLVRSVLAALILTLVVVLYNLHMFWTTGLQNGSCRTTKAQLLSVVAKLVTYSLLPFIAILVCIDIVIIVDKIIIIFH